jgi:ABC-2 type transport system permease protein
MGLFNLAIQDLTKGALQYRIWLHLGWTEVKQKYRRSIIGPWWISLSMLIFISMMGIVFSRLLHEDLSVYVPFFTAGFLFWTFISTCVIEAAEIFKNNSGFIKQVNLPFSLYVFKHMVRQVIHLLHNFVVYILVCLFFKFSPGISTLLVIPGFLLFVINVYWICFLIAIICTRYRDMVPLINSCTQIAFFVTPISWMPKLLAENSPILKYNPLAYLLNLVREPLLGRDPSMLTWSVNLGMALVGCGLCFMVFSRSRSRIAFWVD